MGPTQQITDVSRPQVLNRPLPYKARAPQTLTTTETESVSEFDLGIIRHGLGLGLESKRSGNHICVSSHQLQIVLPNKISLDMSLLNTNTVLRKHINSLTGEEI